MLSQVRLGQIMLGQVFFSFFTANCPYGKKSQSPTKPRTTILHAQKQISVTFLKFDRKLSSRSYSIQFLDEMEIYFSGFNKISPQEISLQKLALFLWSYHVSVCCSLRSREVLVSVSDFFLWENFPVSIFLVTIHLSVQFLFCPKTTCLNG